MSTPSKRKADYSNVNEELKDLAQERRRRAEAKSTLAKDGSTIYLTPLEFISPQPIHMLSIRQLMYEDLLERGCSQKTLQSVLMTTYCMEDTFIVPIAREGVEMCIVTEHPAMRGKVVQAADNVTYVFPSNSVSWGKFHPKLFLLKFPSKLRVVVTSANLLMYDWTKIGQVIWFQDFERGEASGSFYRELSGFIEAVLPETYSMQGRLGIDLSQYDFSQAQVELVASIPGRHTALHKYGQGRLRSLMKESGVTHSSFTVQCSSVGNLDPASLKEFATSFANNPEASCQLVFPTFKTVKESHYGPPGGGTSYFKEEYWNSRSFPKAILHEFHGPQDFSAIRGHLSHSKVVISHSDTIDDNTALYFGSHNMSAAAWGKFEKKGHQLFIGNYELGIFFPPKVGSADQKRSLISRLPFKFPPERYEEGQQPWFINKYGLV